MISIAQIIISVVLIVLIILQERSSGLGGILGGGAGATPYQTRRGLEKGMFWGTVAAAVLFVALAIANLIL